MIRDLLDLIRAEIRATMEDARRTRRMTPRQRKLDAIIGSVLRPEPAPVVKRRRALSEELQHVFDA